MASRARQHFGRPRPETGEDTRERILQAALQVFAARGFDGATLRDITEMAGANIAAVNYHFRSKEDLIRHVLEVFVRPVVEARHAALDRCERAAGNGPLPLEAVVDALVVPMVQCSRDSRGERSLVRLLLQNRALPRTGTMGFFQDIFDPMIQRFVAAFERALPHLSRAEIFWRYDFAVGSITHVLSDSDPGFRRLAGYSGGLCDTDNDEAIIEQLVAFISAGFAAPSRHAHRAPQEVHAPGDGRILNSNM